MLIAVFWWRPIRDMPVNYSKFDHIVDSDDDVPDPKVAQEADRRREVAEQLKARLAGGAERVDRGATDQLRHDSAAGDQQDVPCKAGLPSHQSDRFAHSESDASAVARESLKVALGQTQGLKVSGGLLSVVAVEKVEGEAMVAQIKGESRYIFDVSFDLKVAFKWMGANFDAGMQRAEALICVADFASETTLESRDNAPAVSLHWTDAGALDARKRIELEQAVGASAWPPAQGSLMAEVVQLLRRWVCKLPDVLRLGLERDRQAGREAPGAGAGDG